MQENCKVLVPTLRVGTHRLGRSASFGVEPTLLQHVTSPMDAERPTVRYDAERRNEGKIATLQFSCYAMEPAASRLFLVPTLRVGTHCIGRSASLGVEPTLLQHVTSPMDAERPTVRYDAERRNEGNSCHALVRTRRPRHGFFDGPAFFSASSTWPSLSRSVSTIGLLSAGSAGQIAKTGIELQPSSFKVFFERRRLVRPIGQQRLDAVGFHQLRARRRVRWRVSS